MQEKVIRRAAGKTNIVEDSYGTRVVFRGHSGGVMELSESESNVSSIDERTNISGTRTVTMEKEGGRLGRARNWTAKNAGTR